MAPAGNDWVDLGTLGIENANLLSASVFPASIDPPGHWRLLWAVAPRAQGFLRYMAFADNRAA